MYINEYLVRLLPAPRALHDVQRRWVQLPQAIPEVLQLADRGGDAGEKRPVYED